MLNNKAKNCPPSRNLAHCQLEAWKQNAFTLAEVLITLGIIGIVAALTISNLIVKYQQKTTITKLKKAYNILLNASTSSIAENGPITSWDFAARYLDNTLDDNYIFKYINAEKKVMKNGYKIYRPDNTDGPTYSKSNPNIHYITPDGFHYWTYGSGCRYTSACNWANIIVDIDGNGKKNQYGRDVFIFKINFKSDKTPLVVWDTTSTLEKLKTTCTKSTSTEHLERYYNGETCLSLIARNNWEIPDDYPW